MTNGIDVSQWQGSIDFNKVKAAGVNFVIIRAGYGKYTSQKDPYFEQNYTRAKAAGLNVGVYWYSYASSAVDARFEAQTCLEVIKGKTFEYPIYFDLEEQSQFNKGKTFCDSLVKAFCGELEKAGYYAGLYISRSPLQNYISSDVANKYALWIAEYSSKLNWSGSVGIWQNTSSYRVNGISGNVDHDYSYIDYPSIIKKAGLNGFTSTGKTSASATLDSSGLKNGDKNISTLAYKQMLLMAKKKGLISQSVDNNNVFGSGTVKATNELLKHFGYEQNGIAGDNLIKKLGELLMS